MAVWVTALQIVAVYDWTNSHLRVIFLPYFYRGMFKTYWPATDVMTGCMSFHLMCGDQIMCTEYCTSRTFTIRVSSKNLWKSQVSLVHCKNRIVRRPLLCKLQICTLVNTSLPCTTQSQHCLIMWPTAQPKTAVENNLHGSTTYIMCEWFKLKWKSMLVP